jgi:hypothetical protein
MGREVLEQKVEIGKDFQIRQEEICRVGLQTMQWGMRGLKLTDRVTFQSFRPLMRHWLLPHRIREQLEAGRGWDLMTATRRKSNCPTNHKLGSAGRGWGSPKGMGVVPELRTPM